MDYDSGQRIKAGSEGSNVPDRVLYILFRVEIGKEVSALHVIEINL